MNLNHAYGTPPDTATALALLNAALDLGCTLLDTAALYGSGENERLLAQGAMHRRAEFTLSSKCVLDMIDGKRGLDGSPAAIAKTVEGSLRAARHRSYRSRLPPSARQARRDRGVGRRAGATEGSGQDRRDRSVRNVGRHDPPRARRPPDRRSTKRIFARGAQSGSRRARGVPGASASASSPSRRWRAGCWRPRCTMTNMRRATSAR